MRNQEEQLNSEAAPEKKKFMKSVASWFVEEEEEAPEQELPEAQNGPEEGYVREAPSKAYSAAAARPLNTPQEPSEEPQTREKGKKNKKSKGKNKNAENGSDEPGKKKRRIPGFLIFLLIVAIIAAAFYIHVRTDIHDKTTENRGTGIGDNYCYYDEAKDQIVKYSTSRGPKVVKNTDEEFEKLKSKLKPADRSGEVADHRDDVAAAIGDSFDPVKYRFIDYASKCVLFSYPNKGVSALWIYNEKYGTAEPVVTGEGIRGIAFGNFIIYARDDNKDRTVCYRVSTSYSGQILSVDEFRTVSKSPVTFWSSTFWDFVKGLVRGLKASTDSRK